MNELEELQNTLFTIYKRNTTFLKSNYPAILKKVQEFEKLNVETEYIDFKNNGYFEITNSNSLKGTYNCNSYYDSECRAKNISKSNAIFSMLVEKIDSKNYNEDNEISAHKLIEEVLSKNQNTIESKKLIYIGTLLGLHINEIHKKNPHQVYLVIEPSIERFRLSLFFTDYQTISETSKIFFSINEDTLQLKKSILEFLEYKFLLNNYIKFELASESEYYLIDILKNIITSVNPFISAFSEDIISLKRGLYNIQNTYGLLNIKNLSILKNKPLLILGAGPSLEQNQNFIKDNSSKFLIICASAALKRLENIDVIPDIIINIDKKYLPILEQFNVDEKYYKNSIILLGPKTNPKVLNKLENKNIFVVQENLEIFKNYKTIDCVSVGDFAVKLSQELSANEIYILGIDAAFTNEKTHDSLHLSNKENLTENTFEKDLIEVEGNFENTVKTNLHYSQIIESFKTLHLSKDTKVFNLSDGAKFKNVLPLKIKELNLDTYKVLNKDEIKKNISSSLIENSINTFSSLDKKEFQKEIKILKKLKLKEEEKEIYNLLKKFPSSRSLNILYKYFKLIKPYSPNNKILQKQYHNIIDELKTIFTI